MKIWLLIALTTVAFKATADDDGSCIKPASQLGLDARTFECRQDSDCKLIDEGCRSCQAPIAVNRNYVDAFTEADESDRVDSMCLLTCEACDQVQVVVSCQVGKCMAAVDSNKQAPQVPQDSLAADPPKPVAPKVEPPKPQEPEVKTPVTAKTTEKAKEKTKAKTKTNSNKKKAKAVKAKN